MRLCRRREVELCARLLGVAATGLNANPGLLAFVAVAKLAMLLVLMPIVIGEAAAFTNGRPCAEWWAPYPEAPRLAVKRVHH